MALWTVRWLAENSTTHSNFCFNRCSFLAWWLTAVKKIRTVYFFWDSFFSKVSSEFWLCWVGFKEFDSVNRQKKSVTVFDMNFKGNSMWIDGLHGEVAFQFVPFQVFVNRGDQHGFILAEWYFGSVNGEIRMVLRHEFRLLLVLNCWRAGFYFVPSSSFCYQGRSAWFNRS